MKLEELINEQLHERYKHLVIYGPPFQGKSKLAKHLASIYDGIYLDLLQEIQKNDEIKSSIDLYGPSKLIGYINHQNRGDNNKLVVIDQMDFLINTWDDHQFREFMVYIDRNPSDVCCMFVMQNNRILVREALIKPNDKGHTRLINIFNIQQGGTIDGEN